MEDQELCYDVEIKVVCVRVSNEFMLEIREGGRQRVHLHKHPGEPKIVGCPRPELDNRKLFWVQDRACFIFLKAS